MSETITLSKLAKVTGLAPRTLQFWTSNRVLEPVVGTLHGGSGRHRRYPERETDIAKILAELGGFSVQIGTLSSLATHLRQVLGVGAAYGFSRPEDADQALNADCVRAAAKDQREKLAKAYRLEEVPRGKQKYSREERLRIMTWASFERAKGGTRETVLLLRIRPDGQWLSEVASQKRESWFKGPEEPMDLLIGWTSVFAINIGTVLWGD